MTISPVPHPVARFLIALTGPDHNGMHAGAAAETSLYDPRPSEQRVSLVLVWVVGGGGVGEWGLGDWHALTWEGEREREEKRGERGREGGEREGGKAERGREGERKGR